MCICVFFWHSFQLLRSRHRFVSTSYRRRSGGRLQTLVQYLAENYIGTAQMCNLVGEWLAVFDGDDSTVDDAKNDGKKPSTASSSSSASRNLPASSNSASTASTTSSSTLRPELKKQRQEDAHSSIAMAVVENHLKTLISQRFDPKKADTIWGQKVRVALCLLVLWILISARCMSTTIIIIIIQ